MSAATDKAAQPMIFVTGASRSGTTLVGQVLGRHSQIAGLREMQYFGDSWSPRGNNRRMKASEARRAVEALFVRQGHGWNAVKDVDDSADIKQVLASLPDLPDSSGVFAATVAFFAARAGKRIPCDQTPRNIYYARTLLEQFPNARVVHMLRDPRAVLASQKSRWRKRALLEQPTRMSRLQQLRARFNYHPYSIARLWNRATLDALQLKEHPRFHILPFESLISAPEELIHALCSFLELDYEAGMLDVEHTNSSYVASTGRRAGFSRAPIDAWRKALTRHEVASISERCAVLMAEFGYVAEFTALSPLARLRFALSYVVHAAGALALNPRRLWIQARATLKSKPPAAWQPEAVTGTTAQLDAPTKSVFGLACMDVPVESASACLVTCATSHRSCRVVFVNAHCLNVSVTDAGLRRALRNADIVFADGVGMLIASALQGQRLENNVNGTDLFPALCDQAAAAGVSIGFLGAAPGVADRCVEVLAKSVPGLQIRYSHDGFFDAGEDADIVTEINASGVQILLVAMGVPQQERWINEHSAQLAVPVVIGVGALLDFVAGRVPRAPSLLRTLKLEWLFRLGVEPRRLFTRYVVGNPLFLIRALRYSATGFLWGPIRSGDG
jgi:N-acetylglucosaminyldiphosphoundecaprenol N-acetyl-beta-D-mannosaminyltransferase